MSNAFTKFLGSAYDSFTGGNGTQPFMKDYQHADRLYVRDTYARAPKHGFLYFVSFNINPSIAARDPGWGQVGPKTVGLLVKKIDLPKFQIHTETLNQYNRKTVVQTNIKYNPISCDFHDDNSDITTGLWLNYYQYYYGDGNGGTTVQKDSNGVVTAAINGYLGGRVKGSTGPDTSLAIPASFRDTKYRNGDINFNYGLNNSQTIPFFNSIDIYVLHQHKFTQYTLINPLISEWTHDSLDQDGGNKTLASKMQVAYETVLYKGGKITKGSGAGSFIASYYDTQPSPLSIGGIGSKSLLGPGGVLAGAKDVFGDYESGNVIGALLKGKTLLQNAQNLTKAGIKQEGIGAIQSVLGNIAANAAQGIAGVGSASRQGLIGGLGFNPRGGTRGTPSQLTGR